MWRLWCLLLFVVACYADETFEVDSLTLARAINAVATYRDTTPIVDGDIAGCLVRIPYRCGADGCAFATDPSIIPVKKFATTISSCIRVLGRYWAEFQGHALRGVVFLGGAKVLVCVENDDPAVSRGETLYIDVYHILDYFEAKTNKAEARSALSFMSLGGGVVCLAVLGVSLIFLLKRR